MRFSEVTLQATDADALVAWYRDALGLPPARGSPPGIVVGATTLRFERSPASSPRPLYHFAINIPEDRVEDAIAWLRERAPVLDADGSALVHYPEWDAHAVYFTDAAGNLGELIARHTLRNATTRAFDASCLLEVSEVGLPCPDVLALATHLERALGVRPYRPAHDRFAPMGDERGLLILAREGRPWFPGDVGARPFPTRVVHDGPAHVVPGLPYRFEDARAP